MDTLKIIDALGGNKGVAEICGISESAVSQWKTSSSGIPRPWLLYFKSKYKKVFRDLKENQCANHERTKHRSQNTVKR